MEQSTNQGPYFQHPINFWRGLSQGLITNWLAVVFFAVISISTACTTNETPADDTATELERHTRAKIAKLSPAEKTDYYVEYFAMLAKLKTEDKLDLLFRIEGSKNVLKMQKTETNRDAFLEKLFGANNIQILLPIYLKRLKGS